MALTDSLISYWELDETSDGSGAVTRKDIHSTNDLTDNNTTASGTGKIHNGADFEVGNSEFLSIADASQSGLNITGDHSISCWLKFESFPASWAVVSKYTTTGDNRAYRWRGQSNTSVIADLSPAGDGTGLTNYVYTSLSLLVDTWYHFVFIYDNAGTAEVYLNGSSLGSQGSQTTSIANTDAAFAIGSAQGVFSNGFDGIIDEVGIWSRVLTSDEVTTLYNDGTGLQYPFSNSNFLLFFGPQPSV